MLFCRSTTTTTLEPTSTSYSTTLSTTAWFPSTTEREPSFLPSLQPSPEWEFNEEFELTSKNSLTPKRPRRKNINLPKFKDPARVRPIIKYNDCSKVH